MASSSTIPHAAPDPSNLGIHTPANLNRGARAALLQNSPATTPSSPFNAVTTAAAAEGAVHASPSSIFGTQPISIIESANELAREYVEEHNAKLVVFQAFCAKFEEAAQQFAIGPQRRFAKQFADSFLGIWEQELSSTGPAPPKPIYSNVAAAAPPTGRDRLAHPPTTTTTTWAATDRSTSSPGATTSDHRPTRQDLRVFVRLEAEAPARDHSSYAIWTLIREKLGPVSDKIRQVFLVRSRWAILAADTAICDFLIEK
ncbi:hypothetical protein FOTG_16722 [Fusarium oxysporum f. sp. vasinfectum 25433]|uniref:Uncharacterized protein n=1 Tax=Fusarium oxysporum f. sp. vasinfectum 25433 TaxID=1089449 RepID=X0KMW7_FUSOX|nr:hypothetical protein FOTG_16722 [Fusarium oxysporum f. sp. vasinfectum 25433]